MERGPESPEVQAQVAALQEHFGVFYTCTDEILMGLGETYHTHPGFIATAMVTDAVASITEEEGGAFHERILGSIPMGHMGGPVDIANGVLFLASDESRYMTGSELVIDGGYIAR